jgi:hypothetical protein
MHARETLQSSIVQHSTPDIRKDKLVIVVCSDLEVYQHFLIKKRAWRAFLS